MIVNLKETKVKHTLIFEVQLEFTNQINSVQRYFPINNVRKEKRPIQNNTHDIYSNMLIQNNTHDIYLILEQRPTFK